MNTETTRSPIQFSVGNKVGAFISMSVTSDGATIETDYMSRSEVDALIAEMRRAADELEGKPVKDPIAIAKTWFAEQMKFAGPRSGWTEEQKDKYDEQLGLLVDFATNVLKR